MRRAARTDATHAEVVGALRACGAKVRSLATVGDGMYDLLVGHVPSKRLALFEVKDGSKPPSARALTPDQVEFTAEWGIFPLFIVYDAESAIRALHLLGNAVPKL
jgi:hypothetical protein